MPTQTQYTEWCAHGYLSSDPWTYTTGWTFGWNGSHDFRAAGRFPAINLPGAVIQNISMVVRRLDTGGGKNVQTVINQSKDWSGAALATFTTYFPAGSGTITIDLSAQKDLINSFTTPWYIHLNRNYALTTVVNMDGDEDGTNAPRIITTYENPAVKYYTGGAWQNCSAYYRDSTGAWVRCTPYYYTGGAWVKT